MMKLMEKYFDQGTLTEEEMRDGIQKGMLSHSLFPLFCASAEKKHGCTSHHELP